MPTEFEARTVLREAYDLPPCVEACPAVKDPAALCPDMELILEGDEWDHEWRLCIVDVSLVGTRLPFNETPLPGENERMSAYRFTSIREWAMERGGLAQALDECPPVLLCDAHGMFVIDGWHRLVIAVQEGLTHVTAMVGLSPSRVSRARTGSEITRMYEGENTSYCDTGIRP